MVSGKTDVFYEVWLLKKCFEFSDTQTEQRISRTNLRSMKIQKMPYSENSRRRLQGLFVTRENPY